MAKDVSVPVTEMADWRLIPLRQLHFLLRINQTRRSMAVGHPERENENPKLLEQWWYEDFLLSEARRIAARARDFSHRFIMNYVR